MRVFYIETQRVNVVVTMTAREKKLTPIGTDEHWSLLLLHAMLKTRPHRPATANRLPPGSGSQPRPHRQEAGAMSLG